MTYSVDNIIKVATSISSKGISTANFATAMVFAIDTENTGTAQTTDTSLTFTDLATLATYYPTTTETYKAAAAWLGGIPTMGSVMIYKRDSADADWPTTLNKARNNYWWFWTFVTKTIYDEVSPFTNLAAIANWCNDNKSYFMNCQSSSTNVDAIRDESDTTDIASVFTTSGYRYASTFANATGDDVSNYAGIRLAKWFAAVNYNAVGSTITGEYKKLSGVAAETLSGSAYTAMTQDTKKCQFYSVVGLDGSTDNGQSLNTWSHSSFGEWMDNVIDLAAFINFLKTNLYNTLVGQVAKMPYTPDGFQSLLTSAQNTCELYIANRYLGPRTYIDPDDGVSKTTRGYELLTQADSILDASTVQRADRESPSIQIRLFPANAIHVVQVGVEVF